MIPSALKEILSRWDPSEVHNPDSTAPKILYTIPNGGNPTGASMTAQRKKEVYEVWVELAVRFILLQNRSVVSELHFHFFHSWHSSTTCWSSRMTRTTFCSLKRYTSPVSTVKAEHWRLLLFELCSPAYNHSQQWVPTFLSMDVDGRIIRTDSFSKILSSGWVCECLA